MCFLFGTYNSRLSGIINFSFKGNNNYDIGVNSRKIKDKSYYCINLPENYYNKVIIKSEASRMFTNFFGSKNESSIFQNCIKVPGIYYTPGCGL